MGAEKKRNKITSGTEWVHRPRVEINSAQKYIYVGEWTHSSNETNGSSRKEKIFNLHHKG
jgi:hypothetical protein